MVEGHMWSACPKERPRVPEVDDFLRFCDDVGLGRRLIRMRRAKGSRQRTVPIHPALVALFDDYLATRLPLRDERALFVGVQGRRLTETIMAATAATPPRPA